jgi:hypothetical protein
MSAIENVAPESASAGISPELQEFLDDTVRRIADPAQWPPAGSQEACELLYAGILAYGVTNDESRVAPLGIYYRAVKEATDGATRLALYHAVRDEAARGYISANAVMPFFFAEDYRPLVAEATIDYCMILEPPAGDPLHWPRHVVERILPLYPANRGAIFGGLVCLGDARVHELLDQVKWQLAIPEVNEATRAATDFAHRATVEFWLRWAEEITVPNEDNERRFGACAAALASLAAAAARHGVFDQERNFGYLFTGEEEPARIAATWPREEFARLIEPRLLALEAAERPLKVFSHVLTCWGLQSQARVEQRWVVQ